MARLHLVRGAFALAFVVLIGRAAQVQIVDGARNAATARAQRTERVALPARRGAIYDRNGVTLALTQEVYHVGVAPNELVDPSREARLIARQLDVRLAEVRRRLRRRYAYFHGPYSSLAVAPLRGVRGVHLTSELVRFYPDPDLAAAVIGRPADDGRPASGLERVLDSVLTGRPGSAVVLRDRSGREFESPSRLSAFPVAGSDVVLTLDADLQEIVQTALDAAVDRFDAVGGDVVVLNPRTGEILAVASERRAGGGGSGAFTSVFEPGSTAKVFAAAALLTDSLAVPDDSVWTADGEYTIGRRTIRDDHPVGGWLTLPEVIQHSSNVGIVKFASRLSPTQQFEMLRNFGFGTPTGVEFPAESQGILRPPSAWSGTTAASLAIGYEVAVTVLQLAQAYAAIANDGVMLQPTLIREVQDPSGTVLYRTHPTPVRRAVPAEVARALRTMLRGVVYRGGTAETAALSSYQLAGKTGTARRAGPRGYIPGSYTADFASLFPADDPQLVMVVKLDDPKGAYARVTAAPVTREVLEQLLATQSSALDRARLGSPRVAAAPTPPIEAGRVPWVVEWPRTGAADSAAPCAVPDVTGQSLRDAARVLHRAGLHVKVQGWGEVVATVPEPGTVVASGALITVTARPPSHR